MDIRGLNFHAGSNDSEHGEEESFEASMPLVMPRRSRQVTFTCNKCGKFGPLL